MEVLQDPVLKLSVGGAPCAVTAGGELPGGGDATAVSLTGLLRVRQLVTVMQNFVDEVYLPDLVNIGSFYKHWFTRGENVRNFITYGDFDGVAAENGFGVPRGVVLDAGETVLDYTGPPPPWTCFGKVESSFI